MIFQIDDYDKVILTLILRFCPSTPVFKIEKRSKIKTKQPLNEQRLSETFGFDLLQTQQDFTLIP